MIHQYLLSTCCLECAPSLWPSQIVHLGMDSANGFLYQRFPIDEQRVSLGSSLLQLVEILCANKLRIGDGVCEKTSTKECKMSCSFEI